MRPVALARRQCLFLRLELLGGRGGNLRFRHCANIQYALRYCIFLLKGDFLGCTQGSRNQPTAAHRGYLPSAGCRNLPG